MPNRSDYTYGNCYQEPEPYRLYGDRSIAEDSQVKKEFAVRDLEYLHGMYPRHIKRLHEYVILACDHLDYENSPMYDEYPERLLINQVCDSICLKLREEGVLKEVQAFGGCEPQTFAETDSDSCGCVWGTEGAAGAECQAQDLPFWNAPERRPPDREPGRRPPDGNHGPEHRPGPRPPHWEEHRPGPRPPHWEDHRPGPKPPHWDHFPDKRPPYERPSWEPPKKPVQDETGNWLNGVVTVLLLNEMHRRRCGSGLCK